MKRRGASHICKSECGAGYPVIVPRRSNSAHLHRPWRATKLWSVSRPEVSGSKTHHKLTRNNLALAQNLRGSRQFLVWAARWFLVEFRLGILPGEHIRCRRLRDLGWSQNIRLGREVGSKRGSGMLLAYKGPLCAKGCPSRYALMHHGHRIVWGHDAALFLGQPSGRLDDRRAPSRSRTRTGNRSPS